jgi:hypothetical protein
MAAPFVLPVFNVAVRIWRNGNPTTNPPDVTAVGNLSPGRLVGANTEADWYGTLGGGWMWLRLPRGTDVRDRKAPVGPDTVEVPGGTGRFYTAEWVDDISLGFTTEHRFACLRGVRDWPVPFPGGGTPPPPPPPGPPTLATVFDTGGAPHVTVSATFNAARNGPVFLAMMWFDDASSPQVNGMPVNMGIVVSWTNGLHTIRMGVGWVNVPAGVNTWNVGLSSGLAKEFTGQVFFGTVATTHFDGSFHNVGPGSPPTVNYNFDVLAPTATAYVFPAFGTTAPPIGGSSQAPYNAVGTSLYTFTGVQYGLITCYLIEPGGPNPMTCTLQPGAGWTGYGATVTSVA